MLHQRSTHLRHDEPSHAPPIGTNLTFQTVFSSRRRYFERYLHYQKAVWRRDADVSHSIGTNTAIYSIVDAALLRER